MLLNLSPLARRMSPLAMLVAMSLTSPSLTRADEIPVEQATVDALNALFGAHPGLRANHTKGLVVEGMFTAAPAAAAISRAPHFQNGVAVPVIVRFSDATGLPAIPDGDPNANPHGIAIRFHLPDGSDTDIVANSLHFFPVATIEDFRDLLLAVGASGKDAAKPTKLDQFVGSHPAVGPAFASTQSPASFAQEEYFGVNAFMFTNQAGETHATRYRFVPLAGVAHLKPEEAAKRAPDYLMAEIAHRLSGSAVQFRLEVQVADASDSTKDSTIPWPEDRKIVQLGTITLTKAVADSAAAEKPLLFLPGQLTDGIEVSDDPIIPSRDAAYAVSFSRRQ